MRTGRALAIALTTTLVLAACGGGDGTSTQDDDTSTQNDVTTTSAFVTTSTTSVPPTTAAQPDTPPDLGTKPVVTTPGGDPPTEIVTIDIVVGDGEEAVEGSVVSVHYVGVRYSDGIQFDASWDRAAPFEFVIGAGQVIRGWDEGVAGMRVGGRRELVIPAEFAYGDRSPSEAIPPGSALIFVVDLLDIVPPFPDPQINADGSVTLANQGGEFEGNLPWNSDRAGPGLFAGDEIAEGFPDTEGVQIFLTFNIEGVEIPEGQAIASAVLSSRAMAAAGTPFDDLGPLIASPVRFETFPPTPEEREPIGPEVACVPDLEAQLLTCDVAAAMAELIDGEGTLVSFRLRFALPSDQDGQPDVAVFFFRDPNLNERGIFTLDIVFG
jgi:peptidylprolyl isomerase